MLDGAIIECITALSSLGDDIHPYVEPHLYDLFITRRCCLQCTAVLVTSSLNIRFVVHQAVLT